MPIYNSESIKLMRLDNAKLTTIQQLFGIPLADALHAYYNGKNFITTDFSLLTNQIKFLLQDNYGRIERIKNLTNHINSLYNPDTWNDNSTTNTNNSQTDNTIGNSTDTVNDKLVTNGTNNTTVTNLVQDQQAATDDNSKPNPITPATKAFHSLNTPNTLTYGLNASENNNRSTLNNTNTHTNTTTHNLTNNNIVTSNGDVVTVIKNQAKNVLQIVNLNGLDGRKEFLQQFNHLYDHWMVLTEG